MSASTIRDGATLDCDVVVVGTGAGGGMLLRDVARAGLRVIAVEEGGFHTKADFDQRERHMLPLLYQDAGARQTRDGAVAILQGRGVGGSTVHNTNLCKRAPDRVLADWATRLGLASWASDKIAADYAAVEADLGVSAIDPAQVNRNNDALRRGMAALGWKGGLLHHNRKGCIGSGYCELGCAYDAKLNVPRVLVPDALAHGAEIRTDCRAERVLLDGDRAVGVTARGLSGGQPGPRLTIRARAVVLAGSAVGSATLALASGLPDRRSLVGRNLHIHPGAAVAGFFDERVEGWVGIPQSVECTEWIDWEPGSPRRTWIVPAMAHPVGIAAMLPGFGAPHMRLLRRYPNVAVLVAMLHDESAGRVGATRKGRPQIDYALNEPDARALAQGMAACARLLLAAGAREVLVPTATPRMVRTDAEAATIADHRYRPLDPMLTAVHPMGTLPMASDPARGITDEDGRWFGLKGLFVADGSLFPTSLGGPPQISIYTAGRKVARAVVSSLK